MEKKYIFFCGALNEGGAERVISILSQKFSMDENNNVEVMIYYNADPFYELDKRIKLVRVQAETQSNNLIRNFLFIRNYFKKFNGVVISFLAPFNMLAILSHINLKGSIVVADRNDPREIPSNPMMRVIRNFLYRFADGIVLQTKSNKEYFSRSLRRKSIVIYNPVSMGNKVGMALHTPKKKQIVVVARLVKQKNHKLLIDAFSTIASEFPEYTVLFYGDGPEKVTLEQYIETKNLAKRIFLCGSVTNVLEKISSAELFVLPSNYEGMSNALIEAMCLGLPVISTRVSGATDLIEDGVNGFLVDVDDCTGLAKTMRRLLNNKDLRFNVGEKAVQISEKLNDNTIANQWKEFINSITTS